jgi:hypothetical protein
MPRETPASSKKPAVAKPREFRDGDWQKKIEIAKESRASAIRARKGKRVAFADHLVAGQPQRR